MGTAITPTSRDDIDGTGRWISIHNRFLAKAKEQEPEVLLLGDSLIERLQNFDIWEKMFVPLHCLNFGISGDETQHLLWRLHNGELENLDPKVIIVLIGTNNVNHSVIEVSDAILEIVRVISMYQPQAQILVLSIPPKGESPNLQRTKIKEINSSVSTSLTDMQDAGLTNAIFLNIDENIFLDNEGFICEEDFSDFLHFTKKGYQKYMEPVLDELQMLLKNFSRTDAASVGDFDVTKDS